MGSSDQRGSASQSERLSQTTTDPNSSKDFHDYVSQRKTAGINGDWNTDYYVSFRHLKEYWVRPRVETILLSFNPPINVNIDDIIKRYLRIFSILVYIGRVPYIRYFLQHDNDDEKGLPYRDALPFDLPRTDETQNVWESILKTQWMFSPFQFGPMMPYLKPLDQRRILPITLHEKLTPDSLDKETAVVQVVELHPDYNKLPTVR